MPSLPRILSKISDEAKKRAAKFPDLKERLRDAHLDMAKDDAKAGTFNEFEDQAAAPWNDHNSQIVEHSQLQTHFSFWRYHRVSDFQIDDSIHVVQSGTNFVKALVVLEEFCKELFSTLTAKARFFAVKKTVPPLAPPLPPTTVAAPNALLLLSFDGCRPPVADWVMMPQGCCLLVRLCDSLCLHSLCCPKTEVLKPTNLKPGAAFAPKLTLPPCLLSAGMAGMGESGSGRGSQTGDSRSAWLAKSGWASGLQHGRLIHLFVV